MNEFCDKCGAPVMPGDAFCTTCGAPVTGRPPVPSGVPAPSGARPFSVTQPVTARVSAYAPMGAASVCPQCKAPLAPGDAFCTSCGTRIPTLLPIEPLASRGGSQTVLVSDLGDIPAQSPVPVPASAPAPARTCPNCNAPIEPGNRFCILCGRQVDNAASIDSDFTPPDTVPFPLDGPAGTSVQPGPERHVTRQSEPAQDPVDDDDPTVRPQLLLITEQEAREGCTKSVRVEGMGSVDVAVPAGANAGTSIDILGYGYFDDQTGARGPLRVSFYITH